LTRERRSGGDAVDIVTVGWLTIDDIVLPEGHCERSVLGGGALYAAVGAALWDVRVGVHAVTGAKHVADAVARIAAFGLATDGISAVPGNGLEFWLLHESPDDKQQVPKLASTPVDAMDHGRGPLPAAWRGARGAHIAPQTPAGSFANLASLTALDPPPLVTLDVVADAYVDAQRYRDPAFLDQLNAFLPSAAEIRAIWGADDLGGWVAAQACAHGCHVAAKRGALGALVGDGRTGELHLVPAYPATVVDTTGAGDAFCGGFLAGLVEQRSLPVCAAMATVSACYVVEGRGALATRRPPPSERDRRLHHVLERIETRRA